MTKEENIGVLLKEIKKEAYKRGWNDAVDEFEERITKSAADNSFSVSTVVNSVDVINVEVLADVVAVIAERMEK